MIILLELLGQAIGCLAGPSSSNRKIMDWEQQQILLTTTNCLILAVIQPIVGIPHGPMDSTHLCQLAAWSSRIFVLIQELRGGKSVLVGTPKIDLFFWV